MLSRTQVAELFTKFKSAHQEYSAALQNGDNPDFELSRLTKTSQG